MVSNNKLVDNSHKIGVTNKELQQMNGVNQLETTNNQPNQKNGIITVMNNNHNKITMVIMDNNLTMDFNKLLVSNPKTFSMNGTKIKDRCFTHMEPEPFAIKPTF